jgi:hypothetical protein
LSVVDRVARSDDQHRCREAASAHARQHRTTVEPGEPEIEDDQVERLRAQCAVGGDPVLHPVDGIAVLPQVAQDGVAEYRVVLGDQ